MKVALNVQGVGVIRGWSGESLTSGATIREPSLSTSTAANALSGASSWPRALHSAVVPSPEGNEPPSRGCHRPRLASEQSSRKQRAPRGLDARVLRVLPSNC